MRAALPHLSLGWRRAVVAVTLVGLLAFVLSSSAAHNALLHGLSAVERVAAPHPGWAAAFVVLIAALAAMLAFLSSWIVVPFAVYTWGPAGALLLLWIGWLLGGTGSYVIGRVFGRPVVEWLGFGPLLARYEERVSRRTPFAFAFLFQLAVPSEVPGYLFGLGRYPYVRYLTALGLAELPYGFATVYLGAGIVQRRTTMVLIIGSALMLFTGWAWFALHRRLTRDGRIPEERRVARANV
jgi:uncharacterized membrane protein YdjX (TVP38/TMEM64 family)